jgi:TldD protein
MESTGNGRAEDYSHPPIVRMRNTYFGPGDWSYDELIRETRHAIVVDDDKGGQATLDGTITFTAARGFIVEKGEIVKPLRDIVLAGNILELLRNVEAATDKVEIQTLPFGGCGKDGQQIYIGLGGPYLKVNELQIGGR